MEWKEILWIYVLGNNVYKAAKNKNQGHKNGHSSSQTRRSEVSTKIRTKLNAISAKSRTTHTHAVFWGQSETDLLVLEQNITEVIN